MIVSAAAPPYLFVRWLADGAVHRWFEDAVIVDVWLFFFFFCFRKQGWFRQNLAEKDGIVRFFKTTCWRRIEAAPTAELAAECAEGSVRVDDGIVEGQEVRVFHDHAEKEAAIAYDAAARRQRGKMAHHGGGALGGGALGGGALVGGARGGGAPRTTEVTAY